MAARETALNALITCRRQSGWSNAVLKQTIARDKLDPREAALATRLCYGVVQNRGRLDFYLRQLLTGSLKKLHPAVRDILHMGLYQIYDMDKIPDSAALNESVTLARKYGAPGSDRLVNAVLRNAVRTKGTLQEPTSYEDRYSHPAELVSLLKTALPKGTLEGVLKANNEAPKTVIQVNTLKTTAAALLEQLRREGVEAEPHGWMPECLVLGSTGSLEKLPSFQQGLFYVQDPASRLSVRCAGLQKGFRVLDCCAAPGGKSFAAAMAMEGRGSICSCDIHPHKIQLIENGAARLGLGILQARLQDASEFVPEWEGAMDAVLVDAPCSGLGIIRKKPDIRYRNLKENEALPALQKEILANQARYVKKGGVLLYSTCTLLSRENQDVVEDFLKTHPEFSLEKLPLPSVFPENTTGMLTLLPGQWDTDGFFISKMRRCL